MKKGSGNRLASRKKGDIGRPRPEISGAEAYPVQTTVTRQFSAFSGPLPPPDALAAYGDISPDLVDRIVKMAEAEGEHRRAAEKMLLRQDHERSVFSVLCALLVALAGFGLAGWAAYLNSPVVASIVATLDIAAIAGLFLAGRRIHFREERPKDDPPPGDK